MSLLVIYRGLPGSGKTYRAKERQKLLGGRLVGRDHLRQLLGITRGVGNPDQEAEVTVLQERMIVVGLRAGENVYVDDMNLRASYVSRLIGLAQKWNSPWEVEDLTYVDVDVCHQRNASRVRTVPPNVIEDNYTRFIKGKQYPLPVPKGKLVDPYNVPEPYKADTARPKTFLVDIDGTVADHTDIRDHHEYHRVGEDLPKQAVIKTVRALHNQGYTIVFMTGRPESCRQETRLWLCKHIGPWASSIRMRETGDRRADYVVKSELFNKHIRYNYNVVGCFDDRQQVVDVYREMGLTVFQVDKGDF